jgi:hypothetical protein
MDNGGPPAAPILLIFLINGGPFIAFIILYALDFFYLAKEGVYTKEDSPIGYLLFILFFAVAGIPYALLRRRRAVKTHYELGGKPLGGRYIFFNVAFGVVLGIWALILLCGTCALIYSASEGVA